MKKKYRHLSSEEGDIIAVIKAQGKSLEDIADEIKQNSSKV